MFSEKDVKLGKIIILGAGPTGLGAAWRLTELGYSNWELYEESTSVGGLSRSYIDDKGYTWDVGGHVLFSHYKYFDRALDSIMPSNTHWISHDRESWIKCGDLWIPYPFQMNIRYLNSQEFTECVNGIIDLYSSPKSDPPSNFKEWIELSLGKGISRIFMNPYNFKIWGMPLERMSWRWIGERVATVDLKRIIANYVYKRDDVQWGPNNRFKFPLYGGTGAIWESIASELPAENIHLGSKAVDIDLQRRQILLNTGEKKVFDRIISTMPLPELIKISGCKERFHSVKDLISSSTHVIGIGLLGEVDEELKSKCWMYFPEDNCPFYRVTHFSHYSPNNVPDISKNWSIMCEVSETEYKPVNQKTVLTDVVQGAINTGLIKDESLIDNVWYRPFQNTYPIPILHRDEIIEPPLRYFKKFGVYSRGRSGAWKYEVGNMDHSFMQGVECVDYILEGKEEITLNHPGVVNSGKEKQ